jgi:hypothetical protein
MRNPKESLGKNRIFDSMIDFFQVSSTRGESVFGKKSVFSPKIRFSPPINLNFFFTKSDFIPKNRKKSKFLFTAKNT